MLESVVLKLEHEIRQSSSKKWALGCKRCLVVLKEIFKDVCCNVCKCVSQDNDGYYFCDYNNKDIVDPVSEFCSDFLKK